MAKNSIGLTAGAGGTVIGALGLAVCCVVPSGIGILGAVGLGASMGAWVESAFAGVLVASLGLLSFFGLRHWKERRTKVAGTGDGLPAICELQVFSKEERSSHIDLTIDVISKWPKERVELPEGFLFQYEGDEELFLTLARWASSEHRCCAWATFSVEMGPFSAGKPSRIQLRVTAARENKAALLAGFESLAGVAAASKTEKRCGC